MRRTVAVPTPTVAAVSSSSARSSRSESAPGFSEPGVRASSLVALASSDPKLHGQIVAALKAPGRTEGVRKIAERLGVNPSTVQAISAEMAGRPFEANAVV